MSRKYSIRLYIDLEKNYDVSFFDVRLYNCTLMYVIHYIYIPPHELFLLQTLVSSQFSICYHHYYKK